MNLQWNPDTRRSKGLGKCVRYNGSSLYRGCFLFSVFVVVVVVVVVFFFLFFFLFICRFFFLLSFFSWLKNIVRYTGVFVILWLVVSGFL